VKSGKYETTFLGTTYPIYYVTDKTEAISYIQKLLAQPDEVYVIDTETEALPQYKNIYQAALSPHLAVTRLVQIFTGRSVFVFDIKLIGSFKIFTELLETKRWINHNSIFDLGFFYKYFGIKHMDFGCTYLAARLISHATVPTDAGLSLSLGSLVSSLFKTEMVKTMGVSDWSVPELTFEQLEYSANDTVGTYQLANKLAPKIAHYGLTRVYKLYKEAQHPLSKMHLNGIKLDVPKHRKLIEVWRAELAESRKDLVRITGLDEITHPSIVGYLEKTLPSDVLALWPRTETGKLQTDTHAFTEFADLPIVKPFSRFSKSKTLCSSFGDTLIKLVNPATGRLHSQFRLAGARTGRLSCSGPNIQQQPRDKAVRDNYIPEAGHMFVCADYSQIELRCAAEVSQDEVMLKAYRDGVDLHRLTASLISKKRIEDVTKEDRQRAKAFNFGLLFGLGAKKFSHYAKKSYGANVSSEEATAGVATFRETYYGYREWQLSQTESALNAGFCSTPCGKRRCLDHDNSYGPSMNTPIQGAAAECMLSALVRLNNLFTDTNITAKIILNVHDEVLVECLPADANKVKAAVEGAMELGFLDVFPDGIVRGICECKSGKSWGDAK
jgi:DNA polymerase I-like protein with 3'-5' exonuclease and polymerase domains